MLIVLPSLLVSPTIIEGRRGAEIQPGAVYYVIYFRNGRAPSYVKELHRLYSSKIGEHLKKRLFRNVLNFLTRNKMNNKKKIQFKGVHSL